MHIISDICKILPFVYRPPKHRRLDRSEYTYEENPHRSLLFDFFDEHDLRT